MPLSRMADPSELQGIIVWMPGDASSYLIVSNMVNRPHNSYDRSLT